MRQREAGGHHRRAGVEVDDVGKERIVDLGQRLARDQSAGIVDEHVDAAEAGDEVGDQTLALRGFGKVGSEEFGVTTVGAQRRNDRVNVLRGLAAVDSDLGALPRESLRRGQADPRGRSGNQYALAAQVVEHDGLLEKVSK